MRSARGFVFMFAAVLTAWPAQIWAQDAVKIGLNYPKTGPYFREGLDQFRAATMATDEINAAGGIMGKKVELVMRDTQSKVDVTKANARDLITKDGVKMLFGGSASSEAIAMGEVAQELNVPFFGTLTYSNETTGSKGHRHTFRECYNAWMGAKVMSKYMKANFSGKKFFYITADYTWGWTTEESMRVFTGTGDKSVHKGVLTPFPTATSADFKRALEAAKAENPDVLVFVEFGTDMSNSVNMAVGMGLKKTMQFVVPNLTDMMAEGSGPENMEGVLGALPWHWTVPYKYGYAKGRAFVEKFAAKYGRYPSCSGGSAYTILYQYKEAVERAKSFDSASVIKALEGHKYTMLKDEQYWRPFDHQSVQTVYAVRAKPAAEVKRDKYQLDYFEIIDSMPGDQATQTKAEWEAERKAGGMPLYLEKLPGEK